MKTAVLLLLPIFCFAQRGDQIAFQEMRGDTIILQGNYPAVASSDETYLFKWEFRKSGEKIGEYTGNTPYMLAVIQPGFYEIRRYTLAVSKNPTLSQSNEIKVGYLPPMEYEKN